eukprot:1148668-Pyramimonas_sp.AAC.1
MEGEGLRLAAAKYRDSKGLRTKPHRTSSDDSLRRYASPRAFKEPGAAAARVSSLVPPRSPLTY